jgi:succinylglutamic semialdehyde dehydrogenase
VVNLVQGARAPAEALVAHDGVDAVMFTGSVPAGRAIHRTLAGRLEKIVALELGGNNPLVVWSAGDLDAAARLIVKSAYVSSGQRCTCSRRLILKVGPEGNAVLHALQRLIDRIVVDMPEAKPQPFIGPVISAQAADSVLASQADWLQGGGVALRESRRLPLGAAFLSPGLVDVTAVSPRKDEEVFGPLLQVIRVADFDAAIEEANNTRFGLAAGLISDDASLFERFAREVRAGVLNWNRQTTGASGAAPFGGIGQSGNHRPAGYYAADYSAWSMASLIAPGAVKDDEPITGLLA